MKTVLRAVVVGALVALYVAAPVESRGPVPEISTRAVSSVTEAPSSTVAAPDAGSTATAAPGAVSPEPVTPTPEAERSPAPTCPDGNPCDTDPEGGAFDTAKTAVRCPGTGGSYVAGARQIGDACPARYEPPDEYRFECPSEDFRREMVKFDAIAEDQGCGPIVWTPPED